MLSHSSQTFFIQQAIDCLYDSEHIRLAIRLNYKLGLSSFANYFRKKYKENFRESFGQSFSLVNNMHVSFKKLTF